MRIARLALAVGLVAAQAGCNMYLNFARNLINEPAQTLDNVEVQHRAKKYAVDAWRDFQKHYPGQEFSDDYAQGYKDGFADFLVHGYTNQVPAEPPVRFRRNRNFNPEGRQGAEEYFAAFAEGSEAARASGLRNYLVVPVVVPPPPPAYYTPPPRNLGYGPAGWDGSAETLPAPTALPPGVPASTPAPREEVLPPPGNPVELMQPRKNG
jgi:hypothetical protein